MSPRLSITLAIVAELATLVALAIGAPVLPCLGALGACLVAALFSRESK